MGKKGFCFDKLPVELKQHVARFLDPLSWVCLGLTSKRNMVDIMGMLNVKDLTEPEFDLFHVEEKQLARKGKRNHKIYDAFSKAVSSHAAWPAVILGNILWKSRRGLDMDNVMDGIIEAKAWKLFSRFCEEEFFDQHTFSSKTLERIDDYGVFMLIMTRHRIKWMRGWREQCLCAWASDKQLLAILRHPNYEPTQIIQRDYDLKREYHFEQPYKSRKRRKNLAAEPVEQPDKPQAHQPIEVIDLTW